MRRLLLAAFIAVVAQSAHAADPADLPILRGSYREPPPPTAYRTNWQGVYVGGQFGYSSHDFDFSNTTTGLQKYLVRNSIFSDTVGQWQLLGSANQRTTGFGGFAGYNAQFENVVIGVEANYTRFEGKWGSSTASMSRVMNNPTGSSPPSGHTYEYTVSLNGDAAARVNDLATLRVRGGYTMGSFMPYAFAGLAAGFVDINRSVSINTATIDIWTESVTNGDITTQIPHRDNLGGTTTAKSESQKNLLTFGYAFGLGFEYLLMSNVFLRAEYEFTQLGTGKDTIIQLNTGRVGAGFKF